MKILRMLSVLLFSGVLVSYGQAVEPEVPGDHFSLEGALELFKQSASPEEFERSLNTADSKVNNLDLNGDGYIDYIRVHDRYERNVHAFIIQAVISEREVQDVAVITLEKLGNGKAVLQIIGDADVYGVETIIEPTREVRTYAGARNHRTVVNVWAWPSVQYVYGPRYVGWVSPWGWYDRPVWWRPWRPVAYVHYYPIWRSYYPHYAVCHTRRVVYAHHIYHPYRSTSVIVHHRHRDQVSRYRSHSNPRERYEARRSYAYNNRPSRTGAHPERGSDSYRNRSNVDTREEASLSTGRTNSRERSVRNNERTYTTERQETLNRTQNRRPVTTPGTNREYRREVQSTPDLQTDRSATRSREATPVVRERSTVNERTMRTEVERNPTQMRRSNVPATRSSENINNGRTTVKQPTRSASVDRRSSSPSPSVQRSAPVQRSSPAPRIQRSPQRSSGSTAAPPRSSSRSGNVRGENNRGRQ